MAPYVLAHTLVNHIMRSLTDILRLFSSGRISKTSFGVIVAKKIMEILAMQRNQQPPGQTGPHCAMLR